MPKVEKLYAFLGKDEAGDEGITAFPMKCPMPLIGADLDRIDSLRVLAQAVANYEKTDITLSLFSQREDIEVITPE